MFGGDHPAGEIARGDQLDLADDAFLVEAGLAEGDAVRPWEDRP